MRTIGIFLLIFLSGCTASFQPFPGVTQNQLAEALKQRDDNILAIAQAVNKLVPQEKK